MPLWETWRESSNLTTIKRNKKKWQLFYHKFTEHLYSLGYFDNYVGANIKLLKTFCKWVELDKGINIGQFYRSFAVLKEDIPIIVLSQNNFNF